MSKTESEIQIVVFKLDKQEYGISVNKVQEIIRVPGITKLPNMPEYVLGIFNLRGVIIPVLDLKKKFLHSNEEYTNDARVIITETSGAKLGIIVDEIAEIVTTSSDSFVGINEISSSIPSDYLLGIAKFDERLIILLDNEKALV